MKRGGFLILAGGFAVLIVLTAVTGLMSRRRSASTVRELSTVQQRERAFNQLLDDLQADIYLEAILVRDYVLDRSSLEKESLKRQLQALIEESGRQASQLPAPSGSQYDASFLRLRDVLASYNDSLSSILDMDPTGDPPRDPALLLRRAAETRQAAVAIAGQVRQLTEADLHSTQIKVMESAEDTERFLARIWGVTLTLSLTVAGAALLWISRLERGAERDRVQIEQDREELRNLSNRLVRVQEEERKAISRELHDQVGQMLTALRLEVRAMSDHRVSPAEEFSLHAGDALSLLEQTLQTVRDMAMGLRPSMLDDLGLGPAIEWLARDFSRRGGVNARVLIDGELEDLPESHRTCMFRIAQESMTNIMRHARARNVQLSLHGKPDRLILIVEDDGSGINPQRVHRGLGLLGMEERARELKGSLSIVSRPEKGTLLRVDLPV